VREGVAGEILIVFWSNVFLLLEVVLFLARLILLDALVHIVRGMVLGVGLLGMTVNWLSLLRGIRSLGSLRLSFFMDGFTVLDLERGLNADDLGVIGVDRGLLDLLFGSDVGILAAVGLL
jgi:hypothetical protein